MPPDPVVEHDLVEEYIRLGLALGRHAEGFVDAYYGPPQWAAEAAARPPTDPSELRQRARRLLADLESDDTMAAGRRTWIMAQVVGLQTTARRLAGEDIAYLAEIESSYGVRPRWVEEDAFAEAHRRLEAVVPGSGPLAERYIAWREAQVVPPAKLPSVIGSVAEDFRHRTGVLFGLPEGERVSFEMVDHKPWSGFNHYLGDLESRVEINTDLPVLTLAIGSLVSHEAYPGHHTEHCRKEAGLVRQGRRMEETIFLVGTPQCLIAEGLADLALEVVAGEHPEEVMADHFRAAQIPYEPGVVSEVSAAAEALAEVGGNASILLHDRGRSLDEVVAYLERWALLPKARAEKRMQFLTDPVWRAYQFCYIDGLRLCRQFVGGDADRFGRLITEQLTPAQLVEA